MSWLDDGELQLEPYSGVGLNVLFVGDFFPGSRAVDLCTKGAFADLFGDSLSVLRDKDISIVNLECPLTSRREPIVKSGPHLSAPKDCARALQYAGFDVAAIANNHILDHGSAGLTDTIDACRALGIRTVGAAQTLAEAQEPLFLETKAGMIAIINIAEHEFSIAGPRSPGANCLDPVSNYAQIMKAKAKAEAVFVVIHGGHELYPLPSPRMVATYRFFASLGVTAVIGHHPHVASGFEIFEGAPIFYSLGNFLFDPKLELQEDCRKGYFVKLSVVRGRVSKISFHPYEQRTETSGLRLLSGDAKSCYLRAIANHSDTIQNPARLGESWDSFCRTRERSYLKTVLRLGKIRRACLKFGLGGLAIGSRSGLVKLLGVVRCEAHRDVLLEVLDHVISTKRTQHFGRRTH